MIDAHPRCRAACPGKGTVAQMEPKERVRSATILMDMFAAMSEASGPQHWWPATSRWEVIVGAILAQNTAWRNAERAIESLRAADALKPETMRRLDRENLAELIRPAGTFRVKADRLRHFLDFFFERYEGDLDRMFATGLQVLRRELLTVRGIGRETADAILLYAGEKPTFVVDAYTARILRRHGLMDEQADYEAIRDFFESALPADAELFNEYHALLVRIGKQYCRPTAKCCGCPLEGFDHDESL